MTRLIDAQTKLQASPPLLEMRHVRKVFRGGGMWGKGKETLALNDFSLTLDADEPAFTAIAGESGSGKTTLARLLLGFEEPTAGEVLYRGQNLLKLDRKKMRMFRQEVQAIFQDPFAAYNPFYKIDHILTTPVEKFGLAASKSEAQDKICEALETVGLRVDETLGRYPHQLSGGQRQRITIARALLLKPRLIIADEPVSMVDASLRATILESLHRLHRDFDISFIYITHDLTTAYQIAENIVVLYHGTVAEAGQMAKVIGAPKHPYTRELIHSIPVPEPGSEWIDGAPEESAEKTVAEDPGQAPGCKYASRCAQVMPRCRDQLPELYRSDPRQVASCYLYEAEAEALAGGDLTSVFQSRS
ncbi:MAG: ABC transporter ATP-binding protein [Gemmatimonadetes bacterium]|nr:ABC transporter ATP-binding protein [Gemmatimonadota bacterium]